ncbi:ribonucleotide-diphosphate reductase subunit beta [Flammeovirga sp. MY04]|uniref:ribonucleotide-diphosphate reductase subunit beta n=1 Tax=Flammeovirga sp. MY04 TaxID=1191459 RepID=UPI0008060DD4|nr:ribonucleotide-diphosphate reductase subunit beta [Flammeovirga sp. MY04]ANQ48086.1 ribonucleotide-diphosphate reductase subunit beta [Flammeovirga sp. MY04]
MSLLDKRVAYKPFEYPKAQDFIDAIHQTFWIHSEVNFDADIQQFKTNLTDQERDVIGNILKTFAQTETNVQDDFWGVIGQFIPKPEIKAMAITFAENEARHASAYARLNELLDLDNFEAFLEDETAMERLEMLSQVTVDKNGNAQPHDLLQSIAIFSCFTENVNLFSQFAILLSYKKFKNQLKGIGNIIKWSAKDENSHARAGMWLYNTMIAEYPELNTKELQDRIYEAAKISHDVEVRLLNGIFEEGELEFLPIEHLVHFMRDRLNKSLNEIGLKPIFEVNKETLKKMQWFDEEVFGLAHDDFFAVRPTEYTKKTQSVTADDLF